MNHLVTDQLNPLLKPFQMKLSCLTSPDRLRTPDSWTPCLFRLGCRRPLIYFTSFGFFVLRSKWLLKAENSNGETLRHRWLSITGRVFSLELFFFFSLQGGRKNWTASALPISHFPCRVETIFLLLWWLSLRLGMLLPVTITATNRPRRHAKWATVIVVLWPHVY